MVPLAELLRRLEDRLIKEVVWVSISMLTVRLEEWSSKIWQRKSRGLERDDIFHISTAKILRGIDSE